MSQMEQALTKLDGYDISDEIKSELKGILNKIDGTHKDTIESRDKFKMKNSELESSNEKLSSEVRELSKNSKNSGDIEAIKLELKETLDKQYQGREEELRSLISAHEASIADKDGKLTEMSFVQSVKEKGLYEGFDISDPDTLTLIDKKIREKALFKDGAWYVNDGHGNILTDVTSQDQSPLPLTYITDSLKKTLNPKFLSREIVNNGGGTPPPNQPTGKKSSDMSETERMALFKSNPTEFNRLFSRG